jgi:hypothetical protein
MEGIRPPRFSRSGIAAPEPAQPLIKVPRAVVINAEGRIELLSGKQIIVGRGTGLGDQVTEGVVIVGISDFAGRIRQKTNRAVAIVAIKAGCQRAIDGLALVDQLQAVRVRPADCAILEFFQNLSISGWVQLRNQVIRGYSSNRFTDAIPVSVIHNRDVATLDQTVLEVIDVLRAVVSLVRFLKAKSASKGKKTNNDYCFNK